MRISSAALAVATLTLQMAAQKPDPALVKDSVFEERPALILANDKIELTMMKTGGAFVNLILLDDQSKMSPFWNPAGVARLAGKPGRGGIGGHFVCVDGFGDVSPEEKAAGMPGHGEAHTRPWDLVSSDKKGPVLSVAFSTNLPLVQENFRRTVKLVDGEAVVYVESELENLLAFDRQANWAEHATIGTPFLEAGKTAVDMSASQAKTRTYADEGGPQPHRLADFQEFTWPLAPGATGSKVDIRITPSQTNSLDHTTSLTDPSRTFVFVTALHLEKHLLLGYIFRRSEYPWIQNWESYPPSGGLARGLEFSTQPFDVSHREVIEKGPLFGASVFRWLPAKSKIGSRFLFFYTKTPTDFVKVDDVLLQDGKITIADRTAGKIITLPASLGL